VFAVPGRANDPLASGPHRLLREGGVLTESASDILQELGWTGPGWTGAATASTPDLPPEQSTLWALLAQPATLDDLSFRAGLPHEQLQMALMMLQLGGHIDDVGGRYVRRS
jgi:DNA processing protein